MNKQLNAAALGLLLAMGGTGAQAAGEGYVGVGIPGVIAGYALSVHDKVTVRADYATLGSRSKNGTEEGINYNGKVKVGRAGLFGDYFPMGGGFRLTGGVTFNQVKVDLNSSLIAGQTYTVGNASRVATGNEYFNVHVKFPEVTPFVGIGFGHKAKEKGLGFAFDLGASIGKAKVTVDTNVQNLSSGAISQADIDAETAEIRDGVGKVKFLPQLSVALTYTY
jgi:hypothetical protein